MKKELLKWLRCPECKKKLKLDIFEMRNTEIYSGSLNCICGEKYKIERYIPRFIKTDKYVNSFSFEWNKFRTLQSDSLNKTLRSEKRFKENLDFPVEKLKNKLILDVGCGMGRFMEIANKYQGNVFGIDLSYSVDACFKNIGLKKNIHIMQADLFKLPFEENMFDFIYSLGVLHHTPNCEQAFKSLPKLLKKRGKITITLYSDANKFYMVSSKFWRRISLQLPKKVVYYLSYSAIPLYYFYNIPFFGKALRMILPISMEKNKRWRVLDTFDHYTPVYESHHNHKEVFNWFYDSGLKDIKILGPGISLIGTRTK